MGGVTVTRVTADFVGRKQAILEDLQKKIKLYSEMGKRILARLHKFLEANRMQQLTRMNNSLALYRSQSLDDFSRTLPLVLWLRQNGVDSHSQLGQALLYGNFDEGRFSEGPLPIGVQERTVYESLKGNKKQQYVYEVIEQLKE